MQANGHSARQEGGQTDANRQAGREAGRLDGRLTDAINRQGQRRKREKER